MKNPPPLINARDCCADGEVVVPTHNTPLWIFWGDHTWQDKRFLLFGQQVLKIYILYTNQFIYFKYFNRWNTIIKLIKYSKGSMKEMHLYPKWKLFITRLLSSSPDSPHFLKHSSMEFLCSLHSITDKILAPLKYQMIMWVCITYNTWLSLNSEDQM